MSEPGSPENPTKKVWGIKDTPDEIRAQVDRHVHKSEIRQRGGKHITSTEYDAKGITEENRPPEVFRHKGHEPPPLPEGKFVKRHGKWQKVE